MWAGRLFLVSKTGRHSRPVGLNFFSAADALSALTFSQTKPRILAGKHNHGRRPCCFTKDSDATISDAELASNNLGCLLNVLEGCIGVIFGEYIEPELVGSYVFPHQTCFGYAGCGFLLGKSAAENYSVCATSLNESEYPIQIRTKWCVQMTTITTDHDNMTFVSHPSPRLKKTILYLTTTPIKLQGQKNRPF